MISLTSRKVTRNSILGVMIILYSVCLFYWMFIGFGRTRDADSPLVYNVVPFETIILFIRSIHHIPNSFWIINLFGNIGVFIPFGLILPVLFTRFRSYWKLTLYFVPIIIMLEVSQMVLRVGSCDIDDLILNMVGVWLGYSMLRIFFKQYIT